MIKVRVERAWNVLGYNVWIMDYTQGRTRILEPIQMTFKERPEGWTLPEPTLQLPEHGTFDGADFLRALVEGIMEAGLVPMVSKDNAGQVEAMKENLKDLRTIISRIPLGSEGKNGQE